MGQSVSHSISRRSVLVGGSFAAAACASGRAVAQSDPVVLFVCRYGTVKSPVAREHFRRLAQARGIAVRAESRGVTPEDHVSASLLERLSAEGIDIRSEPIGMLTAQDLAAAEVVVVFDPLPEGFSAHKVLDWSDTPSMNSDYAAARAVLIPRLEALLAELASR